MDARASCCLQNEMGGKKTVSTAMAGKEFDSLHTEQSGKKEVSLETLFTSLDAPLRTQTLLY